MLRFLLGATLTLAATGAAAQTPSPSPDATAEIESQDGGFRIVMPCQPDPQRESPVSGLVQYSCSTTDYFVRVSSVPVIVVGELDAELVDEVGLAIDDLQQGRLESEEPITLGPYRGRAFRASSGDGIVTMHRIYLVPERNRMYHVMSAANADKVPEEQMNAFLSSFAIIDAPRAVVTPAIITSRVASKMNRLLPAQIDQDTELLFTVGLEGVIAYHYRLPNLSREEIDAQRFIRTMQDVMIKSSCSNEQLRGAILSRDLIMRHIYADRDLRQVGILDVDLSDCSAGAAPPAPAADPAQR